VNHTQHQHRVVNESHVIERREDALLFEVRQSLADVGSQTLNLVVLPLGDSEHTEMHAHAVGLFAEN
jgi:hypothetical protein